ncbi:outer membrane protein [Methylosinus sp. Sm6]|uniref:outer membrane protein n=1 Tax=Methylosinus sp. Sm6 TaxID=2866948 RepID=UPI001C9920D3|nr:outer membrane beta-barrel protein [Methylosinus sp. Sm6]MBY6242998.1 outer membrane beta-barrel protein [Methylosinus sp. Sm6]
MRRIFASTTLVFLSTDMASAGSPPRYNEPPSSPIFESRSGRAPEPARGKRLHRQNDDVTGSLPIIADAQPRADDAPQPAFVSSRWTGFYVGANVGPGWAITRAAIPGVANVSGVGMYGVAGGVTAGFDYRFGSSFVAGVAADGSVKSTEAKASGFGKDVTFREAASWALRGRLGGLVSEDTLVYATAGVTQAVTKLGYPNGDSDDVRYTGAIFGVGVETRLAPGLYGRAEYLHSVYGQRNFDGGLSNARPETAVARVGLILKPFEAADCCGAPAGVGVPSAVPRESWTGAHVGAHGGYAFGSAKLSSGSISGDGVGGTGGVGGALLGYDYQLGRSVFGLEIDGSGGGARSTASVTLPILSANAQITYDWDYSIRARAGHLFGDTLLFGSVGWTQTYAQLTTAGLGGLETSHVFSGVQFGAGMETMLTAHVGARLEYLQSFYDKYASVLGSTIDARPTIGKTRAAVIYKF